MTDSVITERLAFDHWSEVPGRAWPWPNFTPVELASNGDGSLILDPDAVDRLQWLRDVLGAPVIVTSAYRDPVWNALVGGAPMSRHKEGDAFDLALRPHGREAMLDAARRAGFRGFGFYQTFLHMDMGRSRHWYGGERSRQIWTSISGIA